MAFPKVCMLVGRTVYFDHPGAGRSNNTFRASKGMMLARVRGISELVARKSKQGHVGRPRNRTLRQKTCNVAVQRASPGHPSTHVFPLCRASSWCTTHFPRLLWFLWACGETPQMRIVCMSAQADVAGTAKHSTLTSARFGLGRARFGLCRTPAAAPAGRRNEGGSLKLKGRAERSVREPPHHGSECDDEQWSAESPATAMAHSAASTLCEGGAGGGERLSPARRLRGLPGTRSATPDSDPQIPQHQ